MIDRQTHGQTDRQTDWLTDRDRETERGLTKPLTNAVCISF